MSAGDVALAWASALLDELVATGVRDVCICPGSRSTPLALAAARQPGLRRWLHLDERAAGFFALGLARGCRRPAAVLCTSGSAAANLLPAAVEARYGGVPLILLTADRPPELRDWGAPQTIAQADLFAGHTKWRADPGPPQPGEAALRHARALARRAAAVAGQSPMGPVHLNLPFREPLLPSAPPPATGASVAGAALPPTGPATPATPAARREPRARPAAGPGAAAPVASPAPETVDDLAHALGSARRPLIVCGPQDDPGLPGAAAALAAATGAPLLADALSQVRCGSHYGPGVLDAYDACLREPSFAARAAPDLVVRFGAPPTSKALGTHLAPLAACRQVVVDAAGYRDPERVAEVVPADPATTAAALLARLPQGAGRADAAWLGGWRQADRLARRAMSEVIGGLPGPSEVGLFGELAPLLPAGARLMAGNSMPVRDLDGFLPGASRPLRVLGNRGANGIDGVLSSALGTAAAAGPSVLVLGDLSFYHDLNGLLAARRYRPPLVVVLVDNDGGGIFSFLPQARLGAEFEELFGTPHGLDLELAADLFGVPCRRLRSWADLRAGVADGLAGGGTHVLILTSDRARNAEVHAAAWEAAGRALRAAAPLPAPGAVG